MKKYIGVLAIAFFATACSSGIDGVAVAMSKEDQAQYDLEHLFQVTGVADSVLQNNCKTVESFGKDKEFTASELTAMGRALSTVTPYKWPEDQTKLLSIVMMSSYYYCPEFYYLLGK